MTSVRRIGDTMEQTASTRRMLSHHISYGALEQRALPAFPPSSKVGWQRNYSTFRSVSSSESSFTKDRPYLQTLSDRLRILQKNHPALPRLFQGNWKIPVLLVLCLAVSYYHFKGQRDSYSQPEWKWDHNVYNPRQPVVENGNLTRVVDAYVPAQKNQKRNLLVAQFSGNPALDTMASISSRPNRAYARQWVRDYVRYTGSSTRRLERACFDKVYLLSTILTRQVHLDTLWSPSSRVQYDTIILLPPDAIITDLDSDLLNLFPPDKLLGVASYEHSTSIDDSTFSEVLFFNLRHKYAMDIVEFWYTLTEPPVTCGAGNDIQLLLDAVGYIVQSKQEREELVANMDLSDRGFVGNRAIKLIPPKVPSSKAVMLVSNAAEIRADLQTTADSVCYRYYPRCDVL